MEQLLAKLKSNNFKIFNRVKKQLTKQELISLYTKISTKPFFPSIIDHMTIGESEIFLLVNDKESIYNEEKEEEIPVEPPLVRIKKLIGDKDPEVAKTQDPESLRAIYGIDIVKNGFSSSDTEREAYKEKDIFGFKQPEKIPQFIFNKFLLTLDDLIKFCLPPHLEHPDVTGRLDVFALYGPVLNYHSIECCFCNACAVKLKKQYLAEKTEKQNQLLAQTIKPPVKETHEEKPADENGEEEKKLTISPHKTMYRTKVLSSTLNHKFDVQLSKIMFTDEDMAHYEAIFCDKCKHHIDNYRHIVSGKEGRHLLIDNEINDIILNMNKNEILSLLQVEKSGAAKVIITIIDEQPPAEIKYTKEHIQALMQNLEPDYYGRYDYYHMQKVIMEDRRLRMNYWMSKIIGKPIQKFENPIMKTDFPGIKRDDIRSPYYTTNNVYPISIRTKEQNKEVVQNYNKPVFDHTIKLTDHQLDIAIEKAVSFESHKVANIDSLKSKSNAVNALMLRPIHEGQNGGWDNYCTLKGISNNIRHK